MTEISFQVYNATSTLIGGFPLGSILPSLILFSIVFGLFISFLSYDWFKKYFKLFKYVGRSFIYFLKGLAVLIGCLAIYGLYWLLSNLSEENIIKPEYYLYAVLGYLGISGLGYIADRWYKRIREYRKRLKK